MIHAYLFCSNQTEKEEHGKKFEKWMNHINKKTGANITVGHDFFAEVFLYRNVLWRCDGICRKESPTHGMYPYKLDEWCPWWIDHNKKCGGSFHLVLHTDNNGTRSKLGDITNKPNNVAKIGDKIEI